MQLVVLQVTAHQLSFSQYPRNVTAMDRRKKGCGQVDAACGHGFKTKPRRYHADKTIRKPTDRTSLAAPPATAYSQIRVFIHRLPRRMIYLAKEAFDDQCELLLLHVLIQFFRLELLYLSVQLLLKSFRLRDTK